MNSKYVKLGDTLTLNCSITYHSQLKVTLTLSEASRAIAESSMSQIGANRPTCTVSATILARKSHMGPFQCVAVFTEQSNASITLDHTSVELRSNEIEELQPACTFIRSVKPKFHNADFATKSPTVADFVAVFHD